jgi:hypothetical protein
MRTLPLSRAESIVPGRPVRAGDFLCCNELGRSVGSIGAVCGLGATEQEAWENAKSLSDMNRAPFDRSEFVLYQIVPD